MNKVICSVLTAYCILFTISQAETTSALNTTAPWHVSHPTSTPFGTVFTNDMGTSLYLYHNDATEELFSAPGCGMYFMLSPDRSTIGFKEIFDNGTQGAGTFEHFNEESNTPSFAC